MQRTHLHDVCNDKIHLLAEESDFQMCSVWPIFALSKVNGKTQVC